MASYVAKGNASGAIIQRNHHNKKSPISQKLIRDYYLYSLDN